jgi:hypothetical protein
MILKIIALMTTTRRSSEIVPACGLVTTVTLLQPRPFSAGHMSHHQEAGLHEMAWRGPMPLQALPSAWRRMNIGLDKPALGTVAERTVLAKIPRMNIIDTMAGDAVE